MGNGNEQNPTNAPSIFENAGSMDDLVKTAKNPMTWLRSFGFLTGGLGIGLALYASTKDGKENVSAALAFIPKFFDNAVNKEGKSVRTLWADAKSDATKEEREMLAAKEKENNDKLAKEQAAQDKAEAQAKRQQEIEEQKLALLQKESEAKIKALQYSNVTAGNNPVLNNSPPQGTLPNQPQQAPTQTHS